MKKKSIIMAAALLLCTAAAQAQPKAGTWSVLPRVGVTLANVSGDELYAYGQDAPLSNKYRAGLMAGVDVEYQVSTTYAVSLGAYYSRQGSRFGDLTTITDDKGKEWTEMRDMHYTYDYVNVPLMLSGYIVDKLALKMGVQLGINTSGKYEWSEAQFVKDNNDAVTHTDFETTKGDVKLKKMDFSIPIGLSYEYMNVVIDARYNWGLTKIYDTGVKGKNSFFTFNVAYRFEL